MKAVADVLKKGMQAPEEDDEDDSSSASADQVAAFKAMERGKTPEEKATALKAFIKLCSEDY